MIENNDILEETKEVEELVELEEKNSEEVIEEKPEKKNLITKIKELSPKKKILFIVIPLVLILTILIIIFFVINKEEENEPVIKDPEESIVIEKENYIYEDGKLTLLSDGSEVGFYECENKDENLCYVAYYNGETKLNQPLYVDESKEPIKIPTKVYDKYVFIFDNEDDEGNFKLIDLSSNETIGNFISIKNAKINDVEYLILQDENNNYGLYDIETMENILTKEYTFLDHLDGQNNLIAYDATSAYIIDISGKELTTAINGEVKVYNDKYLANYQFNSYKLSDYLLETIKENIDYITLEEDYYTYVDGRNLYLESYDGIKYNQGDISLIDGNFEELYIFNEFNEKIDEDFNYRTEKTSQDILVTVKSTEENEEYAIKIKDGEVSKSLSYHSYYDGKIYFYGDQEKTQPLGSYTCKNKNSLGNNTLETCYPAEDAKTDLSYDYKDTTKATYTMPIINNQYVFIQDGSKIALYDLKSGQDIIYSYDSVNIVYDTVYPTLTPIIVNNVDVIATNESLKFGVINISTSVTPKHQFQYTYISRLNTGYALQNEGSWELVNDNGNRYPNFPGVIKHQEDSYLIVDNNGEDFIYDLGGNKISDQGFEYIKINSNYRLFAGIKNNKLYVYETNGTPTSTYGDAVIANLDGEEPIKFINASTVAVLIDEENYQNFTITLGGSNGS